MTILRRSLPWIRRICSIGLIGLSIAALLIRILLPLSLYLITVLLRLPLYLRSILSWLTLRRMLICQML